MIVKRTDPRLREQFNTMKESGSINLGSFGKPGEHVKVSLSV